MIYKNNFQMNVINNEVHLEDDLIKGNFSNNYRNSIYETSLKS